MKRRPNSTYHKKFCRICLFFVFIKFLFFAGCIANPSYIGDCSAETKANIRNSFVFISAEVFLPKNKLSNLEELPDKISEKHLRLLHSKLQETLTQVCDRHNLRHEKISEYMNIPLRKNISSKLILTNTGKPLIHAEVNGDIVLDLRVLQALFRSTLIKEPGEEFAKVEIDAEEKSELERIEEFLQFKKEVERTMAFPKVLDVIDFIIDALLIEEMSEWTESRWHDFASTAAQTDEWYLGAILFLFSHEVGHLVLGHFDSQLAKEDPDWLERVELQADEYAATLLSDAYLGENIFGGQIEVTARMSGYELYFKLAEKLVGFQEDATEKTWLYPTSDQRMAATQKVGESVRVKRLEELGYEYNYSFFGGWKWRKKADTQDAERSNSQ